MTIMASDWRTIPHNPSILPPFFWVLFRCPPVVLSLFPFTLFSLVPFPTVLSPISSEKSRSMGTTCWRCRFWRCTASWARPSRAARCSWQCSAPPSCGSAASRPSAASGQPPRSSEKRRGMAGKAGKAGKAGWRERHHGVSFFFPFKPTRRGYLSEIHGCCLKMGRWHPQRHGNGVQGANHVCQPLLCQMAEGDLRVGIEFCQVVCLKQVCFKFRIDIWVQSVSRCLRTGHQVAKDLESIPETFSSFKEELEQAEDSFERATLNAVGWFYDQSIPGIPNGQVFKQTCSFVDR